MSIIYVSMKRKVVYLSFIIPMLSGCVIPSFGPTSVSSSTSESTSNLTSETPSSSTTIPNPTSEESTSIPTSEISTTSASTTEENPSNSQHFHEITTRIEDNVEPTCLEDGHYTEITYCEICGEEFSREEILIPALGHDLVHHEGKPPTCTEDGYEEYDTCTRCDYSTYQEIHAEGHKLSDWEVIKEATSSEEGIEERRCEHCDYVETRTIDKLVFPVFTINTVDNTPITSKEEYVQATLDISEAKEYNASNLSLGIRGRGNYSWSGTEKKSYRIKFDSKYQPLGQGKGPCKSWTLLAVHCDKSLLRTDAAFYFASKLSNIPFVSSSSFVDLYLNGQYDGVYELCDQIQVNKYRVNINDSGEDEDIGYLAELDKNASEDVITLDSWMTFELKSDYANANQMAFITNYLNQCDNALYNGSKDEIISLIDIPSAIDSYLVEELFKNLDVGWGSFYYTKPAGDKLYFGPVWDFDLTSGNADSDNGDARFRSYMYTYVGNDFFNYMQQHDWYCYLRENDWFNDLIKQRWEEIKDYATETVQYIKDKASKYHDCFNKNFERWDIFDQKINREPTAVMNIKTFDGQVNYLTNWLTNRINWLNKYYAGTVTDL